MHLKLRKGRARIRLFCLLPCDEHRFQTSHLPFGQTQKPAEPGHLGWMCTDTYAHEWPQWAGGWTGETREASLLLSPPLSQSSENSAGEAFSPGESGARAEGFPRCHNSGTMALGDDRAAAGVSGSRDAKNR